MINPFEGQGDTRLAQDLMALCSPLEAIGYLKALLAPHLEELERDVETAASIIDLYQAYFPTELEQSVADGEFIPGVQSELEVEFFCWVDENLFPISYDQEERVHDLWPAYLNVNLFEDTVEDPTLGQQLVMSLVYGYDSTEIDGCSITAAGEVRPSRLKELCLKENSPLRGLYFYVLMVSHETGSVFLDNATGDDVRPLDRDSMEQLIKEYQVCQHFQEVCEQFDQWLEHDNPTIRQDRIEQSLRLWNRAARDYDEEGKQLGLPLYQVLSVEDWVKGKDPIEPILAFLEKQEQEE